MKTKNMTTLHVRKSSGRSPLRLGLPRVQRIWIRRGFLLIPLALACFALLPTAQGVFPAPDGGYSFDNTAEGTDALFSLTTGGGNTANGAAALYSNTTGISNTATGFVALYSNTTGGANTANGVDALYSNTTGYDNTANGVQALFSNTTGYDNTANGDVALVSNTTGYDNTANGVYALHSNTTGYDNTANGFQALFNNTTGFYNTANGLNALYSNTTGARNTANGVEALFSNTKGSVNTATGFSALYSNTIGYHNTANGYYALYSNTTGGSNTAEGYQALQNNTGSDNTGLGVNAGLNLTTGSQNIDIGNSGVAAEANTMRIGRAANQTRAFIAGIRGVTTANANAVPVVIDSAGQLGTMSSSKRFKKEIKPMDQTSEAILGLKPVTFHYKSDSTGTPQFGLIAEEVAKVNPDLVVRGDDGEIYTVRYEAVNAMLLNEFLKEHRKVERQEATIAELKSMVAQQQKGMEVLTATVKEEAAQIQKASAQIEVNRSAPQIVDNHQ